MKPQAVLSCLALFPGRAIFWLIAALFSNLVPAQFNIAQQPLTAEKPMDPNVVYIHDDYPSMNNTYMPDETPQGEAYDYYGVAQVGHLRAAPFLNVIFYNPDVTYQPPVRHDGTRLTHLRNSDKLSTWPEVCQDGYAKQVQEGGACANKTRLIANSATRETGGAIPITGTGAAAAAYWDYVPAYNSMRDNPNFNPKVKPEDDMYNYEYWAFRPAKPGYFFRTNDKLAQTYYRSATGNGTLVGNRACPTIFREVTDSREYYGGLESSSGAYSGRLQNPVPQLPEQSWRGGVVHAHCRTGYRLWDVHEEGVGHGYLSTSYFEHGGTMPFNLVRPRSRWCMDATRYDGVSGGVLRPWEPYPWVGKPDWPSTGERITCYAGRHAIGDTTGKGYWDKNKDAANAPVSHFEYKGQIFNSPGTCANGICNNLNGAEQSRPHLVNQFVNDNGELVTEKTPRRRTSQEEIRNFMNWYTYYRTRNMAAKAGMSIAFSQFVDWKNPGKPGEAMQGRHIRLGYDTTSSGSMSPRASAGRGPGQMDSSRNGIGVVPFRDFPADATEPDGTKSPYAGQQFVRRFYDWLLAVSPQPSAEEKDHQLHMALNNTGNYFRTQAPWKEYPPTRYIKGGEGGTGKVFGCRRSFSILMTDGNAKIRAVDLAPFNAINGGDVDGATLPRVVKQDSNGNPVRSYQYRPRAPFFGQHKNYAVKGSLADIAMYYWGVDLLPNVPNQVAPTKRNPAFWQHMQTFTIGLGVQGSLSDIDVNNFLANSNPTRNILWTYPGGLNEQYEQNDDLMHAGLNGHGGTMAATAAEELAGRISALITEAEGDPTSKSVYAGSGGKALGKNDLSYRTEYDPAEWTGGLYAHRLCVPEFYGRKLLWGVEICKKGKEGSLLEQNPADPAEWQAQARITAQLTRSCGAARRNVFTWDGAEGIRFDTNLPLKIKEAIDVPLNRAATEDAPVWDACPIPRMNAPVAPCLLGRSRTKAYHVDLLIDYLRGDRTWEDPVEIAYTGQTYFGFRNRSATEDNQKKVKFLGDMVNSNAYVLGAYDHNDYGWGATGTWLHHQDVVSYRTRFLDFRNNGRLETIFVGANDGMLHAIRGRNSEGLLDGGEELFAFIPQALHGKLKQLADPEYGRKHSYFVDGSPAVSDVLLGERWHSVLVGHTGRGARSFFALDVEDPENFSEKNVLWEFTDPDLGFPVDGEAVIAPVTGLGVGNGKWAVTFGNGYNSDRHDACLFVIRIERNATPYFEKICVDVGDAAHPNGLGTPYLLDLGGDGTADFAYAGDALGNLWKFDLRKMMLGNGGVPLLRATDRSGRPQPISAPPSVIEIYGTDAKASFQVIVGTGKYFEPSDVVSQQAQSIYGVRDLSINALNGTATRADLMQRHYGMKDESGRKDPANDTFYKDDGSVMFTDLAWKLKVETPNSPDYGQTQKGYVIDLDQPRMGTALVRAQGTPLKNKTREFLVPTTLPTDEPCTSALLGGAAEFNFETGAWLKTSLFKRVEYWSNFWRHPGTYGAEVNRDDKYRKSDVVEEGYTFNRPSGSRFGNGQFDDMLRVNFPGASDGALELHEGGIHSGRQSWRQIR